MNTSNLKSYAPQARRDFIAAFTARAAALGLSPSEVSPVTEQGDVAIINGFAYPKGIVRKRRDLVDRIYREGFSRVIECAAYTWFNRFAALRYMELHGYLDHGYRVLSHPDGRALPQILDYAEQVQLPGVKREDVIELKLAGDRDEELYRKLLFAHCEALHLAMPLLFKQLDTDPTDLLVPTNLLNTDSLIRRLVTEVPEEDWENVEVLGWLYQFYISDKKAEVIGKVVKSEDIPAATQLFTPNWIVKYLVQNSLGRQWLATYPDSRLRGQMEYYIEPAEQPEEVRAKLAEITPSALDPEKLTLIDPACGSGHILVEAYELFKAIYLERGYLLREVPRLILEKNLFGLEIDDRAAQLASFCLLMKARADDRTILSSRITLNVLSLQDSEGLATDELFHGLTGGAPLKAVPAGELFPEFEKPGIQRSAAYDSAIVNAFNLLFTTFEHAKTFGSLIQVGDELKTVLPKITAAVAKLEEGWDLLLPAALKRVKELVRQAELLGQTYDCVVANPPYMGAKYQVPLLKKFLKDTFPMAEKDLFSASVFSYLERTKVGGHLGFMTPFVWMFISSYEEMRATILREHVITSLVQLEYSGFAGATVPICTFTLQRLEAPTHVGSYIRLSDFVGAQNQAPKTLEAIRNPSCGWFFTLDQSKFFDIPGAPIAYWVSDRVREIFREGTPLGEIAEPRQGMATSDNARFLRLWWEVDHGRIGFGMRSRDEARTSRRKWFPYNKGGDFRKWYGNNEYVVNWENDGAEVLAYAKQLYGSPTRTIKNISHYFREGVTWTFVSSSAFGVRFSPPGFLFDVGGSSCFPENDNRMVVLGLLGSNLGFFFLRILNPTLNFQVGNVSAIPLLRLTAKFRENVGTLVTRLVDLHKVDWDSTETSWDYEGAEALQEQSLTVEASLSSLSETLKQRRSELRELEDNNNGLFGGAYQLDGEFTESLPDEQITLRHPNTPRDIRELLSHALGCMMGRYSLDEPGLIYAHSGNIGFDPSRYQTFPADADGIVPVTDLAWFDDDAANRFAEFIAVAWPKEHLEENLTFVAETLGTKEDETARDTIRRYFARDFFKNHMQMYKKRPIYWLFTSGKTRAFQCLVYLHRYNEGALARMRTEYVIPLQSRIAARIERLDTESAANVSSSQKKRIDKERELLKKQQLELQGFDERLRHYADRRIALDLDDGVKVNYGKFGDLLVEVSAICGDSGD